MLIGGRLSVISISMQIVRALSGSLLSTGEFNLVHMPKANILHTRDIFFNVTYPASDYPTDGWIGGMVAAHDRAIELCDSQTRIIPGHGLIESVTDIRAAREMLATIQSRLETMLNAGKSFDNIVAAAPTREFDERWEKGLYDSEGFTHLATIGLVHHRHGLSGRQPA
jgi:cyclase